MDAPRNDLIRSQSLPVEIRAADDGTATLEGYAAVWGAVAEINGWEGQFNEVIHRGAFTKTLEERGATVPILHEHGMDPQIGNKPLGKIVELREDSHGLKVVAKLSDTSYNKDLIALHRDGALHSMSFRFSAVNDDWTEPIGDGLPTRNVREAKLFEVSTVTFPAYEATQAGIRGAPAFCNFRSTQATISSSEAVLDTSPSEPPQALSRNRQRALQANARNLLRKISNETASDSGAA